MATNTDYILGGFQALGQGVPSMLDRADRQQAMEKSETAQNRLLHPSVQKYIQAVLRGEMAPDEAATRAKLEMGGHLPSGGTPQTQQDPQGQELRDVPSSLLTPSLLAGAKPTLPPAAGLMSGAPAMSQASGGLMQARPQVSNAAPPGTSLLQPPTSSQRPFTVRDLGDMKELAPFYQSQMATKRAEENRRSIEAENDKTRGQRDELTDKRIKALESIAGLNAGQRERASQRSFTARMAAIRAMERSLKTRRQTFKDMAVYAEEGKNLRQQRQAIVQEMVGAAKGMSPSATAQVMQDAQRRLGELQKLEEAYEPIRKKMLEISGLSDEELEENVLNPLLQEETSESTQRATPAGLRP